MKAILLLLGINLPALCAAAQQQANQASTFNPMYIERNVFHLKFGASRDALPLWREYLQRTQKRDPALHVRLMTDVSGPAYALIVEISYESFAEMDPSQCRLTNQVDWKEFYQKFIPFCEKAERTYYKVQLSF